MKCLIVVPYRQNTSRQPHMFPLELAYMSASLKRSGDFEVEILNLNHLEGDPMAELLATLGRGGIKLVLTEGNYQACQGIWDIVAAVKSCDRSILTAVGGAMMTGDPETSLAALENVDFGLIGEADLTAPALARALKDGTDPADVQGLIIKRSGGAYVRTEPRVEAPDLGALPWADYEGLGLDYYLDKLPMSADWVVASSPKRSAPLPSTRGCPYQCKFCFFTCYQKYRLRPLDDFFNELDYLMGKFHLEHLLVADLVFGVGGGRLTEFCRRIKPFGLKGWTGTFRTRDLNKERIQMLKEAGCDFVCIGLESIHDHILKDMRKGFSAAEMMSTLDLLSKSGLKLIGNFILAYPQATYEDDLATLDWWQNHPQHHIMMTPLIAPPGSTVYKEAVKSGRIADPVQHLKDGCPPVNLSSMSEHEYRHISNLVAEKTQDRVASLPSFGDITLQGADGRRRAISFEATCHYCGQTMLYDRITMFGQAWLVCHHCSGVHRMPLLVDIKPAPAVVLKNLTALLQARQRVGFWGIGSLFRALIEPRWLDRPGVHLLDRAPGCAFGSKEVEPPEAIRTHGLELLVIPPEVSAHHGGIRRAAVEEYGLKEIITLYDFLTPGLSPRLRADSGLEGLVA